MQPGADPEHRVPVLSQVLERDALALSGLVRSEITWHPEAGARRTGRAPGAHSRRAAAPTPPTARPAGRTDRRRPSPPAGSVSGHSTSRYDQQACREHRPLLAAGCERGGQPVEQPTFELGRGGGFVSADQLGDGRRAGQHVAGRDHPVAGHVVVDAEGACAAERRRSSGPVQDGQLPVVAQLVRRPPRRPAPTAASSPAASRSSSSPPSRGSVTFWLAAAPRPGRMFRHRDATAGDEDVMTMPNAPVSRSTRGHGERHAAPPCMPARRSRRPRPATRAGPAR